MNKQEYGFARKKEAKQLPEEEKLLKIGRLSQLTGVKAGTIRFYEKCGFLEPTGLGCLPEVLDLLSPVGMNICMGATRKKLRRFMRKW